MSKQIAVEKFGWDPGNGVQKAAWSNGSLHTVSFPNVAGIGRITDSGLTLAGLDSAARRGDQRPYQVGFDGVDYLVGPNVADYVAPLENISQSRFTAGAEMRAMFYALVTQLGLSAQKVAVVIARPVEMLADKATAEATEKEMAAWLVGDHRFTIDGVETGVTVARIRASIAQPLGTWLDWGLNEAGSWTRGSAGRTAPVLIVDQGFNTLDLFAVENGKPSERYTAGADLGMARAAEIVRAAVMRKHGVALTLHQVDDLVQRRIKGEAAAIYVRGELQPIGPEIDQALNSLAADVLMFIGNALKNDAGKFRIILTGGGALALASRLQRQYPHAELSADPSLANARGLAKLAVSGFLG